MARRVNRRDVLAGGSAVVATLIAGGSADGHESTEWVYRAKGHVKWFDRSRGYGFIRCDHELPDVLVTAGCLAQSDIETAHEGAAVVFDMISRPKGFVAVRVLAMGPEPLGPPKARLHRMQGMVVGQL